MDTQTKHFESPAEISVSAEGTLKVYISDALADVTSQSKAALAWACAAVNDEEEEHTLTLLVDLPAAILEDLEFYNEGEDGSILIDPTQKVKFDNLKGKLEEALKLFDRIQYME